jgi:hypothetical protein
MIPVFDVLERIASGHPLDRRDGLLPRNRQPAEAVKS